MTPLALIFFFATEDTAQAGGNPLGTLVPLLVLGLGFYFLLIRPQKKRQQEQQALIRKAGVGDEIMTIGGLYGTIVSETDETIDLEVAPGTVLKFARSSVRTLVTDSPDTDLDDDGDLDDFDDDLEEDFAEEDFVDDELDAEFDEDLDAEDAVDGEDTNRNDR